MAIYNKAGTDLHEKAFDVDAVGLGEAFDMTGNDLFSASFSFVAMSYNVQWYTATNNSLEYQQYLLEEYEPDVIGFQEFQHDDVSTIPQMAVDSMSDDYDYEMGDYGNKNALASKYELNDFQTIPHTIQTINGQSYSTASIFVGGKEIFIITAHLTTTTFESEKLNQAHELFLMLQNHPRFILMGDFNTTCKEKTATEWVQLMKQFIDAGYNSANCSDAFGFIDTWTDGKTKEGSVWYPCDHVITSQNITINEVIADETKIPYGEQKDRGIDHLPLVAFLTVH